MTGWAIAALAVSLTFGADLVPSQAQPVDPWTATEAQVNALAARVDAAARAGMWDEAERLVRDIAALDHDHPKAYLRAILLERERGRPALAPALLDSLGPSDGPGRLYGDAILAFFAGRREEAAAGFKAALALYEARRGHIAGQAACHAALANVAIAKREMMEAIGHLDAAAPFLEALHDQPGLADLLTTRGEALLADERADEALAACEEALVLRRAVGNVRDEARTLNILGRCQRMLGRRTAALATFRNALALRRDLGDRAGAAASETEIALCYCDTASVKAGRTTCDAPAFEAAIKHVDRALAITATLADQRELAREHRMRGDLLVGAGREREAIAPYETAAALYRDLGNAGNEARAQAALGEVLRDLAEYRRARAVFEPALDKARAARDRQTEVTILTGLGSLDLATGDLAGGLARFEAARSIQQGMHDQAGDDRTATNLGAVHLRLGDVPRALLYAEQSGLRSAPRPGKAGASADAARARNNLAVIKAAQGSLATALELARDSERLWREVPDARQAALASANAAEILIRLGHPAEALSTLATALGTFRKSHDREGEAYALNLIGTSRLAATVSAADAAVVAGAAAAAIESHRRALQIATAADLSEERWNAHAGLAAALAATGRRAEARRESLAALHDLEGARGRLPAGELTLRFLGAHLDLYEQAITLSLPEESRPATPDEVDAVFALIERSRARTLLDALARARESGGGPTLPDDLTRRRREARDTLGEALGRLAVVRTARDLEVARRAVEEARSRLDSVEVEVTRLSSPLGASIARPPIDLRTLQQEVLAPDEAFLEYFLGDRSAWLMVVTPGSATVTRLARPSEISGQVGRFQRAAGVAEAANGGVSAMPTVADERRSAEALASTILPAPLPIGATRLLIAPDGRLHHLPFEALRPDGQFLIETHEVTVVPSGSVLAILRGRPPAGSAGFLGVANPAGGASLSPPGPPLPFAQAEVDGIAALFPEAERLTLEGDQATRSRIVASDPGHYRYLHFAVHTWVDPDSPRDSGLRLAPDANEGAAGILAVPDILALPLDADLVVLSSCQSAAGELARGEGIVGLTRAFLMAGSRAVLVSLWTVRDRSTADLMLDFHAGLARGLVASAALREAKLHFLASDLPGRNRVIAWAPFVLVGDPGSPGPPAADTDGSPAPAARSPGARLIPLRPPATLRLQSQ